MSIKLPIKARAKAIRARKPARTREQARPIDWLGLWTISLGIAASVLAWIAYFTIGDKVGAAAILAGTAALIGLMLSASARGLL